MLQNIGIENDMVLTVFECQSAQISANPNIQIFRLAEPHIQGIFVKVNTRQCIPNAFQIEPPTRAAPCFKNV